MHGFKYGRLLAQKLTSEHSGTHVRLHERLHALVHALMQDYTNACLLARTLHVSIEENTL